MAKQESDTIVQTLDLVVKRSGTIGRGVFAARTFLAGEVIESAPAIILNAQDKASLDRTILFDYYFKWGTSGDGAAIVLGYGSIYNHSFTPNAKYQCLLDQELYEFIALETIPAGTEIRINYNGDPADTSDVGFTVVE